MYYNRVKLLNSKTKEESILWQVVENGQVTKYVDRNNSPVKLPKVYEMFIEADELEALE
jgi:hypothetical protein